MPCEGFQRDSLEIRDLRFSPLDEAFGALPPSFRGFYTTQHITPVDDFQTPGIEDLAQMSRIWVFTILPTKYRLQKQRFKQLNCGRWPARKIGEF